MRFPAVILLAALGSGACGGETALPKADADAVGKALASVTGDVVPDGAVTADTLFRAAGTEPFWGLQVLRGRIVFTRLGDPRELRFPAVEGMTWNGTREWATSLPGHQLRVRARMSPCSDGMSDFTYSHTVEVVLDGTTLSGCGGARTTAVPADSTGTDEP